MSHRILVIGLDGATFDLIQPWVEEGRLPNIGRLMDRGVYAGLVSTIQPSSEQAWTSFMTGVNNGKHGIYGFIQEKRGTHKMELISARSIKSRSLWKIISESGKKVIVMNVPVTYPPERVNGILMSGLLTPGVGSQFTSPPELKAEILSVCPDYTVGIKVPLKRNKRKLDGFLAEVKRQTEMHGIVARYLLQKYDWDFSMVVFTALDRIQHKFWKDMETDDTSYGKCVFNFHTLLDDEVGRLSDSVDRETNIVIVSDHGFGPLRKGLILNNILRIKGLLGIRGQHRKLGLRSGLRTSLPRSFALRIFSGLPVDIQDTLRNRMGRIGDRFISQMTFGDIDWSRTEAYGVGGGNVRINLAGREPGGVVSPEAYDVIVERVINVLKEIRDPDTGEGIFREIFRREQIYSGDYLDEAPDIIPHYKDGYRGILYGPPNEIFATGDYHLLKGNTGYHTMEGIFIACGPDIVDKGQRIDSLNIIDMAPTILKCLGVSPPSFMDGRIVDEILSMS